jgi:serine/threonine protein kinase
MKGLVKLKLLHMGHIGVQTLPKDFGHLENLVDLHLYGCKNLQTLPQSFGSLQLQRLQMNDNPKLEKLPEGFGRPKKRKHDSLFIVDVPSTHLELGTKSLKNVENTISAQSSDSVLINQLQCNYLFHKLRESLNDAKACIDGLSPQDIQRSRCILESLAQTWKEGEILVGDCCDAQWIRVAMILANAKEHFTSLIFKLRLYMQLFQSIFKEGATKEFLIKLQDRKWSDDVKKEEFPIIDEKALEDQEWLLSRLMEVGSIDSENLIKRLNHPGKIDAWKVAHESIQRVQNGKIGKGASAIVHKVKWLGKHFAEKCFFGPEGEHFQKEASLLAGLSHPNILPLFCFVTTANSCSLVMELMDEDLHELMCERLKNPEIQGAPFKLLEAIDIMLQVAEGMHYLHQKKVVHRDLKSTNILVKCDEHDGHVYAKVADFGLSKTKESSSTYSNLTMDQGTTRWMAPELFGNFDQSVPIQVCQETQHPSLSNEQIPRRYPFKVDIYSFGMVCYEILTGNIPFHDHPMTGLRTKIKDGLRPNLPEQCPHQLSKLIQKCYQPDPATRPSFLEICLKLRHIMCSLMIGCTL